MKKLALISVLAVLFFSCGNQKSKQAPDQVGESEAIVLTVDELYENASELAEKEIIVKGTVMHVCTHGGQRCFLMGSNEDINIRVEAGEKIGAFSQELMGSELEIVGIIKEVKTEADAHNPGQEHGTEEAVEEETPATKEAHAIISEAQEEAEVIYFIEGLKSKEIKSEEL